MLLRTLLFLAVLYLLVRFLGRWLLPPQRRRKHPFFIFMNQYKQQKQAQQKKQQSHRFEEVEEAEYEEVIEEKSEDSKVSK